MAVQAHSTPSLSSPRALPGPRTGLPQSPCGLVHLCREHSAAAQPALLQVRCTGALSRSCAAIGHAIRIPLFGILAHLVPADACFAVGGCRCRVAPASSTRTRCGVGGGGRGGGGGALGSDVGRLASRLSISISSTTPIQHATRPVGCWLRGPWPSHWDTWTQVAQAMLPVFTKATAASCLCQTCVTSAQPFACGAPPRRVSAAPGVAELQRYAARSFRGKPVFLARLGVGRGPQARAAKIEGT
jgi:hypothetical protein